MSAFSEYRWSNTAPTHAHSYLWPTVVRILESQPHRRVFELGCGNGSTARMLESRGFQITGVDPSREGIARAAQ